MLRRVRGDRRQLVADLEDPVEVVRSKSLSDRMSRPVKLRISFSFG